MATIERYVLVDANDTEEEFEHEYYEDAIAEARLRKDPIAIISRVYEYADSELVWTSDGSDVWPPTKRRKR